MLFCRWLSLLLVVCYTEAVSAQPSDVPAVFFPVAQPTARVTESVAVGHEHWFDFQLLLGQQTGLRLGVPLIRGDHHKYVAELFGGGFLTTLGTGAGFGGGGRILFEVVSSPMRGDALLIGPGLHLFYQDVDAYEKSGYGGTKTYPSGWGMLLGADVTVSWLHDFGSHFGWELGLDLGVGIGLDGEGNNHDNRGRKTTLISVYTGFHF